MRGWAIWYRNLVVVWVVIGLPSLVIGYGMAGGRFELAGADDGTSSLQFVLGVAFYLSPFLLWPIRTHGRKQGFD